LSDDDLIDRTLELAARGKGQVSPNPLVGCVIVKDGKIIGEGWHKKYGEAHAEIEAFRNCTTDPEGSTLFVNLEPCSHHGKTPPCSDLIISKKVARVVIGTPDPNPLVNGKGIAKLRAAGIEVIVAGNEATCAELNKFFFKSVKENKPYLAIKAAQTIDGKIADHNGSSKWLSCEESRAYVHQLRAGYDAVLTGINTVKTDDPELNVRLAEGRDPHIIIVDKYLEISAAAKLFSVNSPRKIFIITSEKNRANIPSGLSDRVSEFLFVSEDGQGRIRIEEAFNSIMKTGISSIFVEGGAGIYSYLISNNLFDEILIFYTPKMLGSGLSVFNTAVPIGLNAAISLRLRDVIRFGDDILVNYRRI